MYGFPIGNGNAGFNDFVEKFTNNADSGFPKIQQREVFYSIKDGNWNDITIWQTASGRVGFFPTRNDDVYIKTNVLVPTGQNVEAGNVFVGGTIRTQGLLYCFGNFKCVGIFDGSLGGILVLFSNDNYINNFISGNSTINYAGDLNQDVMPLNYFDLSFGIFYNSITYGAIGIKKLVSDLTISRNLTITYGRFEVLGYNLTVNGITYYFGPGQGSQFTAAGSGYLLFIGELKVASAGFPIGWDFSAGNPTVECRGGIDLYNIAAGAIKTGTGTWYFTTNNQTIRSTATGGTITFSGPVIMSNVNLTVNLNQTVNLNNTINATNVGNKLTNSGTINFLTDTSVPSMTTGQWDFTTNANTIGYTGNYSATIPSYFTNFHNLTISGTGTKTLSVNTTLNGNLSVSGGGTFELSTYNLFITGTTSLSPESTTIFPLQKSGSGSVTFVGLLSFLNGFGNRKALNFSGGNPSVEVRGGISFLQQGDVFLTGTGTWTFSTNNQNITSTAGLSAPTFSCPILISGAITLSQVNSTTSSFTITFTNTINGNNANSKYTMGSVSTGANIATYNAATQPMVTGILDTSTNLNTWIYGLGNQDIKGLPTTSPKQVYRNLTLNGTGVKTLQGYVSVLNTYTLTSPATLDLNGYTLTNP